MAPSLNWCLRGVVVLANLGVVAQIVAFGIVCISTGVLFLLPLVFVLPHGIVAAIVLAHLSDRDVREPVGDDSRRALARMLAALSLLVDMQVGDANLPNARISSAVVAIIAMYAIRRAEFGLSRCIIPLVVAAPLIAALVVGRSGWYSWPWSSMAGALCLYSVCMARLQRAGVGMRPPSGRARVGDAETAVGAGNDGDASDEDAR
jgi:hypothetical protein